MSARGDMEREIVYPSDVTPGGARTLLARFEAQVLREAAAKQRAALEKDPGLFEAELIDLIDPDKEKRC